MSMELAKQLIQDYYRREFNRESEILDVKHVSLAYTHLYPSDVIPESTLKELGIEDYPMSWYAWANLTNATIYFELDNKPLEHRSYETLQDFCCKELEDVSFDDLIYGCERAVEHYVMEEVK